MAFTILKYRYTRSRRPAGTGCILSGTGRSIFARRAASNYNFAALNQQGEPEPPDAILTAINSAMGR